MKPATFALTLGVVVASMLAYTYATVGGQYSVNVHFVPPIVTQSCPRAQFWTPSNVTCALCFCMTGTLSRCIPQPGCRPNAPNVGNTTTTPKPANGTEIGAGGSGMAGNGTGTADNGSGTGGNGSGTGGNGSSENAPPVQSTQKPPASSSSAPNTSSSTTSAPAADGKLRAAKPGKMRRR